LFQILTLGSRGSGRRLASHHPEQSAHLLTINIIRGVSILGGAVAATWKEHNPLPGSRRALLQQPRSIRSTLELKIPSINLKSTNQAPAITRAFYSLNIVKGIFNEHSLLGTIGHAARSACQHVDIRDYPVLLNPFCPFCPFSTAKALALKATVLLLLTLLIKARIQIGAGSALGIVLLVLQTLIFLAISGGLVLATGGAALVAMQRHRTAAA
jgi:hypothetical protein